MVGCLAALWAALLLWAAARAQEVATKEFDCPTTSFQLAINNITDWAAELDCATSKKFPKSAAMFEMNVTQYLMACTIQHHQFKFLKNLDNQTNIIRAYVVQPDVKETVTLPNGKRVERPVIKMCAGTLASFEVDSYQNWMLRIWGSCRADPNCQSRCDGTRNLYIQECSFAWYDMAAFTATSGDQLLINVYPVITSGSLLLRAPALLLCLVYVLHWWRMS